PATAHRGRRTGRARPPARPRCADSTRALVGGSAPRPGARRASRCSVAAGRPRLGMEGPMTLATLMGLCVLGCMAVVAAPLPSSDMIDPESSRARSIRRAEARLGATVFALALLSFGILAGLERGSTGLVVPLVAITAAGLMALHPWILVRLCIPLGLPRLAVSLSRLGGHPWVRDPEGGAVLSGVLAQLRRPVDPAMHAWLRGR